MPKSVFRVVIKRRELESLQAGTVELHPNTYGGATEADAAAAILPELHAEGAFVLLRGHIVAADLFAGVSCTLLEQEA